MGRLRFRSLTLACLALATACAAAAPDWASLDRYRQTMTSAEFQELLDGVYCPSGALTRQMDITPGSARLFAAADKQGAPLVELKFSIVKTSRVPVHAFRTVEEFRALHAPTNAPLQGLRIVLDPGHIGGEWARMEERFFWITKQDRPVQEAVLNLTVARMLKQRLEAAGATVLFTKDNFQPVTAKRPEDFRTEAEQDVAHMTNFDGWPALDREAAVADTVRKKQEILFYRGAEIAARAQLVNDTLKPDLTVCIHFNAVEWDQHMDLIDDNRLVVFIHGDYLPAEMADDDQKLRLLQKLLEGSHATELAVAESVAGAMAAATRLPPAEYGPGSTAVRVSRNPYVYARNLAANRLVDGPVVFLEPYYQNNRTVYQRIQLGDYDGTRDIDGKPYRSIYREYADAVAKGLIQVYSP